MGTSSSNYDYAKVLVLLGGGLAPSSRTVESLLITPWPAKPARSKDSASGKNELGELKIWQTQILL